MVNLGTDSYNGKIVQNLNRNERRWLCRSQIKGMIHENIASLKRAQTTFNQHQIYPRDPTMDANLNSVAACEWALLSSARSDQTNNIGRFYKNITSAARHLGRTVRLLLQLQCTWVFEFLSKIESKKYGNMHKSRFVAKWKFAFLMAIKWCSCVTYFFKNKKSRMKAKFHVENA